MAMCENCIRLNVDISEGIQREASVHFCNGCQRWLQPPQRWISASLESKELMALCLRKLRGLSKVRLVDANFIWTEPHSKRIKLKIKIQDVRDLAGYVVIGGWVLNFLGLSNYVSCTNVRSRVRCCVHTMP
jgi:NMD protein affecting ribosome stability and mRNA decay